MRPSKVTKVLIDADIIAYLAAASKENEPLSACHQKIEDILENIVDATVGFSTTQNTHLFLTGKDNFRYSVAKTYPYKGNRVGKDKPKHLTNAKGYLSEVYGATYLDGHEADDAIAMSVVDPKTNVIVSRDKDFKTINCWMYDFVKQEFLYSSPHDALMYFYEQLLTGDSADNIKGLYRIGPKKAQAILEGSLTEGEMYARVLKAYEEKCTDGDPLERIIENGNLLHLRRFIGDEWKPPKV